METISYEILKVADPIYKYGIMVRIKDGAIVTDSYWLDNKLFKSRGAADKYLTERLSLLEQAEQAA